jgi:anaphase-promoting complex subunit 2
VKELQVLLAQRLLAIKDGNFERVEKEVSSLLRPLVVELTLVPPNQRRNIEILKIRFGEPALEVCEMLKDMTDSKRIDGHVQSHKAVCLSRSLVECWKLMCEIVTVKRTSDDYI